MNILAFKREIQFKEVSFSIPIYVQTKVLKKVFRNK